MANAIAAPATAAVRSAELAPKLIDDEHDLDSFEQHALERDREAEPVEPERCSRPARARRLATSLGERRVLVVQRLAGRRSRRSPCAAIAGRSEQQRADDELQQWREM